MDKQVKQLNTKLNSKLDETIVDINSTRNDIREQLKTVTAFIDQSSRKVDGGWSVWGSWSECSASCGTGMTSRSRSCSNPKPSNGGDHCLGDSSEYRVCNTFGCPSTGIGFSVYNPVVGTGRDSSSALKFNDVVNNSTSAFNMATGEFVCRQSGLYFFTTTVLRGGSTTQDAYCSFYKNGFWYYLAGYASDADIGGASGTNGILCHLLPGDTVSLRSCTNSNYFLYSSSFTGFLVHADN